MRHIQFFGYDLYTTCIEFASVPSFTGCFGIVGQKGTDFITWIAKIAFGIDGEPRFAFRTQNVPLMEVGMEDHRFCAGGHEFVIEHFCSNDAFFREWTGRATTFFA